MNALLMPIRIFFVKASRNIPSFFLKYTLLNVELNLFEMYYYNYTKCTCDQTCNEKLWRETTQW